MDQQFTQEISLLHDQVCSALGDPSRLLILYALRDHPWSVGALADELSLPQSSLSRHLKILRDRALVNTTRQGTTIYYTLADDRLVQALELLRGVLRDRVLARHAALIEHSAATAEENEEP